MKFPKLSVGPVATASGSDLVGDSNIVAEL